MSPESPQYLSASAAMDLAERRRRDRWHAAARRAGLHRQLGHTIETATRHRVLAAIAELAAEQPERADAIAKLRRAVARRASGAQRTQDWRERHGKLPAVTNPGGCVECGKDISQRRPHAQTCSERCRQKLSRRRKAIERQVSRCAAEAERAGVALREALDAAQKIPAKPRAKAR
jgi:predicted nucleic acid-binding Zn ribbon protein